MQEPNRHKLPTTRPAITYHGVHDTGMDFYVTVGFYDTPGIRCNPGEVFAVIAKEGSDIRHFVNAWAQATSIALQYGVPWEKIAAKLRGTPGHPLLASVVEGVDACIEERKSVIGEDEAPQST